MFELYQDEECNITATEDWFQEQTLDFLLDYFEEILKETKVRVDGRWNVYGVKKSLYKKEATTYTAVKNTPD